MKFLFVLLACIIAFALMVTMSMRRYESVENLYLEQIRIEAETVHSYRRILTNTNLSSEQQLSRLRAINEIHASSVADQMNAVFSAHHKKLPDIWKELQPSNSH